MAETDTHSTTPPIELGTPWKSASQNGKTVDRLPLSPEQTHAAVTRQHDSRASATRQRDSEERSTSDHKRSSGGSRQQEAVERGGSVGVERNGGASATTSGDEMTSRRLLSPHNNERVRAAHTTPSPVSQQAPFPPRPSSSLGPAATPATVIAQRRNLAAVSAISCSMCSATGVNSLWRRDRAGKPICGKCCEQLRRRLNPRYAAPTRGEIQAESARHSTSTLLMRRRTPTPPSGRHAPYLPRGPPPSRAQYPGAAHPQGSAYPSGSHHPPGHGDARSRGDIAEGYQGHPANGNSNANGNGSYTDSLRLPRFDPNGRHSDVSRSSHSRSDSHSNGQTQVQGQGTTLPPLSSLERIADHYRPPTSNGPPAGGFSGYRSKEPVALPVAYSRAGGREGEAGKSQNASQNGSGEEMRRMVPLGGGGERERERYTASGQPSSYTAAGAPRRQAPPANGTTSHSGIVTEAEIQAKRALLVEGRRWIFSMLDETTAMLRQLDDASLHVGSAE
ncbi:hypothetical protein QFC24_004468 [Naganishia onofrii]|uniref:Uncharacterized protein n=1 Tax=Naganishia onofrii TaxID=1851511 RepID=A0ACC2XFS6_9TREE|nr:hypothetical protein QFC24_004468 [Naganishia onofrii]